MAKKKQKKEKKQTTYEVNFFPGAVGLVVVWYRTPHSRPEGPHCEHVSLPTAPQGPLGLQIGGGRNNDRVGVRSATGAAELEGVRAGDEVFALNGDEIPLGTSHRELNSMIEKCKN